jgi:hypothetical protein
VTPDKKYHKDCIDMMFHSGQKSTMAWGVFCGTTMSDLYFVPGEAKLDSATYVKYIVVICLPLPQRHCYGCSIAVDTALPLTRHCHCGIDVVSHMRHGNKDRDRHKSHGSGFHRLLYPKSCWHGKRDVYK